jgi:hypothetical protein
MLFSFVSNLAPSHQQVAQHRRITMKKAPSKPVPKAPSPTARIDLTDEEMAYIVFALHDDDSNPDVITPLMAKLACYLAGAVLNK